jgi:hypothetical protein
VIQEVSGEAEVVDSAYPRKARGKCQNTELRRAGFS